MRKVTDGKEKRIIPRISKTYALSKWVARLASPLDDMFLLSDQHMVLRAVACHVTFGSWPQVSLIFSWGGLAFQDPDLAIQIRQPSHFMLSVRSLGVGGVGRSISGVAVRGSL